MSMIYLNRHDTEKGEIVAMCDEELIGKVLKQGKLEIDLKNYASFYKGSLVSEEDAARQLGSSIFSLNAVGNKSVKILVQKGLVKAGEVRKVRGVSFVQIYSVDR
ncbi:MAG: DUF424 family protein [Candidatus Micrarchaeota archaeon]|nr:DUF424 family protein [Candidatus Micrarchaeota archaeon]